MIRRLTLALVAALGLVIAAATSASANAYLTIYQGIGGGSVSISTITDGPSPPRGRLHTCVNRTPLTPYGPAIVWVESQVFYASNGYTYKTASIRSRTYPNPGECAIADDQEWYYTNRHITGGQSWIAYRTSTGGIAVRSYKCSTTYCWRVS